MPLYAVIDTNVLVSAFLKANSIPWRIIEYAFSGEIVPIYNTEIINEYSIVLHRPKFQFPSSAVEIVVNAIKDAGLNIDSIQINEDLPDPKDVVFYAVTLNARTEKDAYLVTGNIKHFPEKPFVVTPRQMLEIIEQQEM